MRRVLLPKTADIISGTRKEIFNLIQRDRNNNINIYFDGWWGIGATTVIRSIAQVLPSIKAPPPRLCFGRTIYVDCSSWTSKRAMQKVIAQQLRLENETMAMFDEQDEEDNFNGVDLASRDVIRSVVAVIDKTLRGSRFMMILINGSDEELVLASFGIPENSDCVILWTFSASLVTMRTDYKRIAKMLRYTDVFLYAHYDNWFSGPQFIAMFREEAANIVARYPCMRGMDLTRVVDCCLYGLLLTYHTSRRTTGFAWSDHAPNFWICDGIIPGDRAWDIINVLHRQISFECNASMLDNAISMLSIDPDIPFLRDARGLGGVDEKSRRWLYVTSLRDNRAWEEVQTILAEASSVFLAFQNKHDPAGLPNGYFKQCNNLGVMVLCNCAFSFLSPPFLYCHTLRFLGLDHCKDDNTKMTLEEEGDSATRWAFLKSVRVIDLFYTDWVEILSEDNIELMANLMELNIEGVRWPRWTSSHQIQKRLPNLQRLRIIKPMYNEAAETETSDIIGDSCLLIDNTSLEILDLSGCNRVMGSISSKASHLQVMVLDGCDGLGDILLPNNSSLRSFSFDGYGPAATSHRASTVELPPEMSRPKKPPTDADKKKGAIKTSIVSLQGCRCLEKLFLRGLPNLVELDLSGCAIKVLDFGSMVLDVPMLKRLFLIGCERLHAIKWGPNKEMAHKSWMIFIDTRPGSEGVLGCARPPSIGSFQLHAIITNARLIRSLSYPLTSGLWYSCYFNIKVTSSDACSDDTGAVVDPEAKSKTSKEMMVVGSSCDQQQEHCCVARGLLMYGDVFTKVGDDPTPMQAFPQAPTEQSNRHIEIDGGSCSMESEIEGPNAYNLAWLMCYHTEYIHVHDVSTCSSTMPAGNLCYLRWCRVERCPSLHAVFPPGASDLNGRIETIWASNLRCCPSLRFVVVMLSIRPSFPSLETLHIIHCGDLRHVFVLEEEENKHTSVLDEEENKHTSVQFPKLATIHLHDLPALQQICEDAEVLAPALETIKIRGCPNLRRLPALMGRKTGMKKPAVEVEKDVWDALEWDGVDAGHYPSLYEALVHSRYYKRRTLRRTVLR